MNRLLPICCVFAAALGQPAIAPPPVGAVRDGSGAVRPLNGIGGNFVLGDAIVEGAICAAFSGAAGFVKTDSGLFLLDSKLQIAARFDAPRGRARFAFDAAGAAEFVQYEETGVTLRVTGNALEAVDDPGEDTWRPLLTVGDREILAADGRRVAIDFDVDSFERMGRDWIAVRERGGRLFALRLNQAELQLFQMPEAGP